MLATASVVARYRVGGSNSQMIPLRPRLARAFPRADCDFFQVNLWGGLDALSHSQVSKSTENRPNAAMQESDEIIFEF